MVTNLEKRSDFFKKERIDVSWRSVYLYLCVCIPLREYVWFVAAFFSIGVMFVCKRRRKKKRELV